MYRFWASDTVLNDGTPGWRQPLNKEIIVWLSKNLRKRPGIDDDRRYKYFTTSHQITQRSKKRKAHKVGVKIYSEDDATIFKLRWL